MFNNIINSLFEAKKVHDALSFEEGTKKVVKNQYGENTLLIDYQLEEIIIKSLQAENVPLRIISEEHGIINITDKPSMLGILDGLDGSNEYLKRGRYGTMFGIFDNLDPKYNDYLFCGIMEYSTGKLFCAFKNKGAFISLDGKKFLSIKCSVNKYINGAKIYIDEFFDTALKTDFIRKTYQEKIREKNIPFELHHCNSSAVHYADVAEGEVDLVLECTRKNNLELATSFGIIKESGGIMMTDQLINLSDQRYLTFGQKKYIPVITGNRTIVQKAIALLFEK